ncbi:MAG: hypothetical protein RL701_2266 [Pseudomonadota bacterium]|jgi:AcrR family transcriptional regulator
MKGVVDEAQLRVFTAIEHGELAPEALSARQVCAFLGYTTGHLYHHFGSLDGLWCGVAQLAFAKLDACLLCAANTHDAVAPALAQAFVEFGIDNPALYTLMFERHYDWAALRERGLINEPNPAMQLWRGLVQHMTELGSGDPRRDARVLFAGLHGLVSLARSGRANVGVLQISDRDAAVAAARRLATLLCPVERSAQQTVIKQSEAKRSRRERQVL